MNCTGGDGGSTRRQVCPSDQFVVEGDSTSLAYRSIWIAVACVAIAFWILAFGFGARGSPAALFSHFYGDGQHQRLAGNGKCGREYIANRDHAGGDLGTFSAAGDWLLGGLLAADTFNDGKSCLSRREAVLYRKALPWKPSSYLVKSLRRYEARHRHCAPYTESYNKTLSLLQNLTEMSAQTPECKYVVWTPRDGLGNRMLSLVSAFLYTLLTGRVLLIDSSKDMADLFCEPIPGSTWLLPPDFPLGRFHTFDRNHPQSYGMLTKNKSAVPGGRIPGVVYLYLAHNYDDDDKAFFCECAGEGSLSLQKIPWMVMKSNQYFVPALFLNPAFEGELRRLFPEKEAVFHHLARYLFHPTNAVWGLITRYYWAYLAKADEQIGIQIRVFNKKTSPFEVVLNQIVNCTLSKKLLPEVMKKHNEKNYNLRGKLAAAAGSVEGGDRKRRPLKAVLLTSLSSGYLEKIKDMYWEHPAAAGGGGEVDVSVHQPSHEEWQQTERGQHDMKALAEMYLLSLSDALVTSGWSTFGYVAQAMGGLRPWILLTPPGKGREPEPACVRALSPEPCFHYPPNFQQCGQGKDKRTWVAPNYVKLCEDTLTGLKLVQPS
ncbi:hypothetical protein Taro_045437 [Colocasia esculenta]|uniref:Fucosyltransferase n=1 Tax=Colocasia esculenta TaxID=4460 RepID=A0A843X085_COLES|nr:hypothetical protein [Colocasia esculenta]